jgi:hypothetical protein
MTGRRLAHPTIVGPASWPAHGPPPRFTVDTAGRPLFAVELATAPVLMTSLVYRCAGNYFYGGDGESTLATGSGWWVPTAAWRHLGRAAVLFYRVVTFDQCGGEGDLSIDDHHLDALPWLVVEGPQRCLAVAPTDRTETP